MAENDIEKISNIDKISQENSGENKLKKQEKLDEVIDSLKNKYGYSKITRAGKMNTNDLLKLKDIKQ